MAYGRPGVYVNETLLPSSAADLNSANNAAGAVLGVFSKGPTALTKVNSWYEFTQRYGSFDAKFPATFGVNQFFLNGGSELYVKRVFTSTDSTPANNAKAASVSIPSTTSGTNWGTATAKDVGLAGNNLRIQIDSRTVTVNSVSTTTYSLYVLLETVPQYLGTNNANGVNDYIVESYTNLVFTSTTDPNYVVNVVNSQSKYITLTASNPTYPPAIQTSAAVLPLTAGSDGIRVSESDYTSKILTDGTSELDLVDRPLVLFAPELYNKFIVDGYDDSTAQTKMAAVHSQMATWSAAGDGFAILETPPALNSDGTNNTTASLAVDYATNSKTTMPQVSQAAVYYPYLYISDPVNSSRGVLRKIGPAGSVAGIYMRTDKIGPFKAPAGLTATISGVVASERGFTSKELDNLNTGVGTSVGNPVNVIRNIRGAGIVVMGARTLLQDGTANRYVNMRRSLIYIKKTLRDVTRFAVFEGNNSTLWAQLRTVVTVFLNQYRNSGGLAGATPAQSFYVKVDSENNTSATISAGEVHIEVGVALQYPSEFVVINLSQITGQ
jgi:phage tail sheath protein FI